MNGDKIDELEGGKVTPDHPKTKWWWCWWGWGGELQKNITAHLIKRSISDVIVQR